MKKQRTSTRRPGQPVCNCGMGYGSHFDGLCSKCRKRAGKLAEAMFRAWQLAQQPEGSK